MKTVFIYPLFLLVVSTACIKSSSTHPLLETRIHPADTSIRYTGRVKHEDDSVTIYWSGTNILIHFKGTGIGAMLRDENGDNYFNIILDGDFVKYFRTDTLKRSYVLAEGLPDTVHTIELVKRTEWDRGKTWFYGFGLNEGEVLPLPPPNERVIEFFGNSITAGYAVEDNTGGDSPDSIFTNNYYTYGAITARHFNADYYATVKSGIGITISWFPLVMPEMYDRLDPTDSTSRWDFTKVTPDLVVINLFQNDCWLVAKPDHPSFKQRFGDKAPGEKELVDAYRSFVEKIRKVYPDAWIICALGSMDATRAGSPWPGYITKAVEGLNDKKILTHFFPYAEKPGHPRIEDNAVMAESLIDFIDRNIQW